MSNANRDEIISAVAMHDIRWIRKNFYFNECKDELAVNTLLAELPDFYKAQDKEKNSKLPKSLVDFFDKHYKDDKAAEKLKEKLIQDFINEKQILLLHENPNSNCILKLKIILDKMANYKVFGLSTEPQDLVSFLEENNTFDSALLCLSKVNDKIVTISMLMYLIGHFGTKNICVIYENDDNEMSTIFKKIGISYDSYTGLGLI